MLEVIKNYGSCVICKYFKPEELKQARHHARAIGGIVKNTTTNEIIFDYTD